VAQEAPNEKCATAAGCTITAAQLAAWSILYSVTSRQLWRWIKTGRDASDPCPLDRPAAVPEWWVRRMTWSVPAKILEVARQAAGDKTTEKKSGSSFEQGVPVNLTEHGVAPGEAVGQQRRLVGALFSQLEKAYLVGDPVDHIQARYNKASEQLRKLEKDEREDKLATGEYLPKAEVERDYAEAAEMLKQMRESMERRILELCPSLTPEQRAEVSAAILRVRSQEDRAFQRLPSFASNDDLLAELAA
jgi:hypothetical protein